MCSNSLYSSLNDQNWVFSPHSNCRCCTCACLHRLPSAATALSLDGWSFSLACSCLMNPAVHVLIECFLRSYVLHLFPSAPPSPYPSSASTPSPAALVCEVGCWWLMNKGSLVSHTSYQASEEHRQWKNSRHMLNSCGEEKCDQVTLVTKMLTFLSSHQLRPLLGKSLKNFIKFTEMVEAGAGNAKLYKALPSKGNL